MDDCLSRSSRVNELSQYFVINLHKVKRMSSVMVDNKVSR